MKFINLSIYLIFSLIALNACSQDTQVRVEESSPKQKFEWIELAKGMDYCETDAPIVSPINDSKITIVKINPNYFDFFLVTATEHKKKSRPADIWADTFGFNMVVNAGMYDLANGLINRGYMKNYGHYNNQQVNPAYNSMIALNPVDSSRAAMTILDLKCHPWENVKKDYHCYAQGMRMIDCDGEALGWNKRKQSCSMLVAALDPEGNIYYIFARSPYTHNEMISFMKGFPFKLTNAIYIEGGPETSLHIDINGHCIQKTGSYVSQTYAKDDNDHFWDLPNVIGIRQKNIKD